MNTSSPYKSRREIILLKNLSLIFIFFFLFSLTGKTEADTVKNLYLQADKALNKLQKDSKKRKYRSNWEKISEDFKKAWEKDKLNSWAPAALYKSGESYLLLSHFSGSKYDREKAASVFRQVYKDYPKSQYKFLAVEKLNQLKMPLHPPPPPVIVTSSPEPPPQKVAKSIKPEPENKAKEEKTLVTNQALIQNIRYQTYDNRTRIVVDTDKEISYNYNDLNRDKENNLPPRIYLDFNNSTLASDLPALLKIEDPQIRSVRIAQNTQDKVRLVIDLDKSRDFKVFQLFDPHRTVMDIWGEGRLTDSRETKNLAASISSNSKKDVNIIPGAIRKQLALGVKCIVIDPGHGGKDPGALAGSKGAIPEKNINLAIARLLADKLRKELKCEVLLTRSEDKYLALEERTQFANKNKADLFISIHTNASLSNKVSGIETYFLNLATDEESIAVAARENATSTKNISDLQTILNDLMQNAKINESSRLASYVQRGMIDKLKQGYKVKDKGVKQAPFYVLLGAHMPSVLIETGFISNPAEYKYLTSPQYQNQLSDGIVNGILRYIKEHSS